MGKDPDEIRQDIAETRARMGETVEAIGYKADIPSRARETVGEKVGAVRDTVAGAAARVTGTASRAGDTVSDATPSRGDLRRGGRKAVSIATENPLGLAAGAAAVGFLAGLLSPSTRVEDERIGPIADQVKEKAKETGEEALQRGRRVVSEVAETAKDTAREEGRAQSGHLAESAREHARDVQDTASEQRR